MYMYITRMGGGGAGRVHVPFNWPYKEGGMIFLKGVDMIINHYSLYSSLYYNRLQISLPRLILLTPPLTQSTHLVCLA